MLQRHVPSRFEMIFHIFKSFYNFYSGCVNKLVGSDSRLADSVRRKFESEFFFLNKSDSFKVKEHVTGRFQDSK